jgi:tetratricopeptide (TPR) repeat protein
MEYYEKALEIAKERGDKERETRAYIELGDAYTLNNQIQTGVKYYEKALEIAKGRGYKYWENLTRNVIEKLSRRTGRFSTSFLSRGWSRDLMI